MRIIRFTLAALFAAFALLPRLQAAAGPTSMRAILITASNEKAPADPRLAAYEATLQTNLPESSFRFVAEGSANVSASGRANIALNRGHRIEVEGEKAEAQGIRLKIQWMNGRTLVIGGTFTFEPGIPIVLGHRPKGAGDVPIVILIAK